MTLPQDIQTLVLTVKGAREADERLRLHKEEQALLIAPKLAEVKDWVVTMANELTQMVEANPALFPTPHRVFVESQTEQHPKEDQRILLDFCGGRVVFEPFLQKAMIQCRPDNQSFAGQYVQTDQVSEKWVRDCIVQALVRYLKADHLAGGHR